MRDWAEKRAMLSMLRLLAAERRFGGAATLSAQARSRRLLLQKTPCLLVEGRRRPTVNNNRGRFGISPTFEVRSASTPKGGVGRPRLSRHGLNERFFDSMAPSLPGTLGKVLVDLRPERCAMNADRIPHLLLKGREVILPLLAPHFPVTILRGGGGWLVLKWVRKALLIEAGKWFTFLCTWYDIARPSCNTL